MTRDMNVTKISKALKVRKFNKRQLWADDDKAMDYEDAMDLSVASLKLYGKDYPHWLVAYSGGKDSSALLAFILYCLENNLVDKPKSLTVLYADTGMELPPLHTTALKVLARVEELGFKTQIVKPEVERRFWVEILGKGLPPPKRTLRWCTERLKRDPMRLVFDEKRNTFGDEVLTLTGVRKGESAVRDQRINASCSSKDGECGQGWFQQQENALAPLLHWRVCWVWDFLNSSDNPIPETLGIVPVYITDDITDIRTGCIGCPIVSRDWALEYLVKQPEFEYLKPLTELEHVYKDMMKWENRLRMDLYEKADGTYSDSRSNTVGPLSVEARKHFLGVIRDIEKRASYQMISAEEETEIRKAWAENRMPSGWTGNEKIATRIKDISIVKGGVVIATQLALPFMTA